MGCGASAEPSKPGNPTAQSQPQAEASQSKPEVDTPQSKPDNATGGGSAPPQVEASQSKPEVDAPQSKPANAMGGGSAPTAAPAKLIPQELVMSHFVPGDVLQRRGLRMRSLTTADLKALRGTPNFLRMDDVFPACSEDLESCIVDFEQKAAAMSGGTFTAEPGEGAVPDADQALQWERGYLVGDAAHEHVPLLLAQLPDGNCKPVAILLHGTGSCKEKMIPFMDTYAKQGFLAVSMDNRHLGERAMVPEISPEVALVASDGSVNLDTGILAKRLAVWARLSRPARLASYQASMRSAALAESQEHPFIFDSAWDVVRVVDYLASRDDVSKEQDTPVVGLMGVSLGGMITQLVAAGDVRIKAAAPMISMQCFGLQKAWKMWAPRVRTLQVPFRAVVEAQGGGVQGQDADAEIENANAFRKLRIDLNDELFDKLGIRDQIEGAREDFIREDDRFMRELGVDEAVCKTVYKRMNPHLLDGTLDGPCLMRCIAPRPLLLANAGAGQRCPVESVYDVFQRTRDAWTDHGKGSLLHLYIATSPILHHNTREDMNLVINQFLRRHVLGQEDSETAFLDTTLTDGVQIEPVPGQLGWLFSGKAHTLRAADQDVLSLQDNLLAALVPGDVLERLGFARESLTGEQLALLKSEAPLFEQVADPFPSADGDVAAKVLEFEEKAAALSGGTFNAEPGEGEVPDADLNLEWERGYLRGDAPHEHVPLLMAKQGGGDKRPVAILLHGTGSCKEKMIPHINSYAQHGFLAVSMDNRYLGERAMAPELSSELALVAEDGSLNIGEGSAALAQRLNVWSRLTRPARLASYQLAMRRSAMAETQEHPFVYDSVWDVIRLLNYLTTRDDVLWQDGRPMVGLMGVSLGGMITQLAAGCDVRITAAVPLISVQCFDLQRAWKTWSPRVKTLQVAFKAMAEQMGILTGGDDVEAEVEKASMFRKLRMSLNAALFDSLGIRDQIEGPREQLISEDDRFMRELGVNEAVVKATYDQMNPLLLDGALDGPAALQAIAPRPLLMANAGAGQRCPIESVIDIFQSSKDEWTVHGCGNNLNLFVATQPIIHHSVREDFLFAALHFLRMHVMGACDTATGALTCGSPDGAAVSLVPGLSGVLFNADEDED